MFYQPSRALGLLVGTLLTLWAAGIALLLLNVGVTAGAGWGGLLGYGGAAAAGALAALFAYWTYSLATLSYALDRNGLVIQWGPVQQVVPLDAIERLVPGTSVGVPSVHGVSWWGHHVGTARVERVGDVLFYSTHQAPEQVLYVVTGQRAYGISVEDAAEFAREVQLRQDLGPTATVSHHVERSAAVLQSFWADRRALWLAGAAIVGVVAVWTQLALRYDSLPAALAIQFPPSRHDAVIPVTGREALVELPRTATLLLLGNLGLGIVLHAWDRMAGYVLLAAAVAVQVAMFAALVLVLA